MRVLAVGCHPDDIEVSCAGTLAKYKKLGHDVITCHVTNGNMGHVEIMPDELREIRINEAKSAGALIGAEVLTCDLGDLLVYDSDKKQRDMVVDIIRYANPDVIITHNPNDYMPDHVAVSKLVFDAAFTATLPHYYTKEQSISKMTPIYYMDSLAGVNFMPTEYVDISETIDLKLQMLEMHQSQLKWMRDHDNIDFAEFVRVCARFRGLQCGVEYAEAFTFCNAYLKIRPERLLP